MKNKLIVFIHIAVWAVIISFPFFANPPEPQHFDKAPELSFRLLITFFCILIAAMFYFNMYVLIPRVLNAKGWGMFLVSIAGCFTALMSIVVLLIKIQFIPQPTPLEPPLSFFTVFFFQSIAISTSIRLSMDRVKLNSQLKDRENESLKSELSLLRSQVSPHFMFNVLNSLASLARKKSTQMEFAIIQLSKLMRYMVYETSDKKITVENEIEYLNSYIDLQKIRFGNDVEVRFNTSLTRPNLPIEPMLLIPFVENAFKHGIGLIAQPIIEINFATTKEGMFFVVRNKVSFVDGSSKDGSSGIGLNNLTRRLNLLYKDKYEIKTNTTADNWHVAELKIML